MRVCMLSYSFYEVDNRVMRYAEALAKRGDHVEVISLRRDGRSAEEVLHGVQVFRIQRRVRNEGSRTTYFLRIIQFFFWAMLFLSVRHLRKPYDLIHVHSMPDFLVLAAWLPKVMGAKIILDIHDLLPEMYANKFQGPGDTWMTSMLLKEERLSCAFADHVIIANHLWGERIVKRSVPPSKCTPILNYPDPSIFSGHERKRQDSRFIFIYPGSLHWHQGLSVAIQALNIVHQQVPQVEFHIYGSGPEMEPLAGLIADLCLQRHVFLQEFLPMREIAPVLRDADVGIVPKRKDSFGNEAFSTKILEFMAVGVPVIVSDTTVDRYYFNDSVVRFFQSGDARDLADAMLEMIHDPAQREKLARNASEFVRAFDWGEKKEEYLRLVDGLTQKSKAG